MCLLQDRHVPSVIAGCANYSRVNCSWASELSGLEATMELCQVMAKMMQVVCPAAITTRFGKFQLGPISWYSSDTDPISGGIHGEADNRAFCRHVPDDLLATEPALLCCNRFSA